MDKLSGKDFEGVLDEVHAVYEKHGAATIGHYGVQSVLAPSKIIPGKMETIQIQSLPDYEGILWGGQHVIFDAKVCTDASFSWGKYRVSERGSRSRQLRHMLKRSRYGAWCFFLLHWNPRELATKRDPAQTYLIPVSHDDRYWKDVDAGAIKSLPRGACGIEIGIPVPWQTGQNARATKLRPDWLAVAVSYFQNTGMIVTNSASYGA